MRYSNIETRPNRANAPDVKRTVTVTTYDADDNLISTTSYPYSVWFPMTYDERLADLNSTRAHKQKKAVHFRWRYDDARRIINGEPH